MVRFTRTTESLGTEPRFQHPPSEPVCGECRPTLAKLHRDCQPDGETCRSVGTDQLFMVHGSQRPHLLTCNHKGLIALTRRRHAACQKDRRHRAGSQLGPSMPAPCSPASSNPDQFVALIQRHSCHSPFFGPVLLLVLKGKS
jgi:hypothetical protein